MYVLWISSFVLVHLLSSVSGEEPVAGTCSLKCQNNNNGSAEGLHSCSCSSSCSIYGDCCYDSPHRHESKRVSKMCISLSTVGRFEAVAYCPRSWPGSSVFCRGSIGHSPPVTSTITGTTYVNAHCAICHGDAEKLKRWRVDLKCCSRHEYLTHSYVYENQNLWSKVSESDKCSCNYVAHFNDTSFANGLELRPCDRNTEISTCSSSWNNDEIQNLCRSFLEPFYVGNRVYKNLYCAQCNFENLSSGKCMPPIVESMLSEGWKDTAIFRYCYRRLSASCLHYFLSVSKDGSNKRIYSAGNKGRSYSFSNLLRIRDQVCIPSPETKECCEGERYDFRNKRCRKIY